MKISRYISIEDRRLSTLERRFRREIYKAILSQVKYYLKNGFLGDHLYGTLTELYRPVLDFYLKQQWDILNKDNLEKQNEFFIDSWGEWINDYLLRAIRERAFMIDGVTDGLIKKIFASAQRGEVVESITDMVMAQFEGSVGRRRARTIARTEVGEAVNVAKAHSSDIWEQQTGMKQGKLWIHRGAKVPRDWHVALDNGIPIPKEQPWIVTDPNTGVTDEMMYPHDHRASPENVINCGCMVIYTRLQN